MIIEGERIVIRAIEKEDNAVLLSMINDPDIERMIGGASWPVSKIEQEHWFEQQINKGSDVRRGIIALKSNNQAIGTVILSDIDNKNGVAEIHIKIVGKGYQGMGYGTEAIKTTVQYAFKEMRLNCIYALVLTNNEPSIKLFEKCGFSKEGLLKARVFKGGQFWDQYSFSIVRSD